MNIRIPLSWIMAMLLGTVLAMSADDPTRTIQGRVVELDDEQGFDQLTLRTSGGELKRFRLGQAGTCAGLVLDGDQVRICPMDSTTVDGARLVKKMKVRRSGAMYTFRNEAGEMNRRWVRTRARDASCGRTPGDRCPRDPRCSLGGGSAGGFRGAGRGPRGGGPRGGGR